MDLKERRLKSVKKMKKLITDYYVISKFAEGQKPIAWVTSGAPVEILYAMDIIPIYPENHSALLGSIHLGGKMAGEAEARGYPTDICSYARCDFGQVYTHGGPIGGLPKPDMLICCNNICGTVIKWYEELARIYDVPLIMIDTPFLYKEMDDSMVAYVETQLEEMVESLERITNTKLNKDRLEEVLTLSAEGIDLWQQILDTGQNKPAPLSCFDAFTNMAPIVSMRGTKECNDYYKILLDELNERISTGFGAIPNERIRLLWDNIPIWYDMSGMAGHFAEFGAALVADTYTHAWCGPEVELNPKDGLHGLARVYTAIYLNINIDMMTEKILELAQKFDVNGVVMHSNRSCKPYSLGQYYIANELKNKHSLPVLIIESDMVDDRVYSKEQIYTRIEAFMEMF